MISFNKSFLEISKEIEESYDVKATIYEVKFPEIIYTVVIKFNSHQELTKLWNKVNISIALPLGEKFTNEFQKWNLYFIYICDFNVAKKTKYKIENDKAFSRKIVISHTNNECDSIEKILTENVLCIDIENKIKSIKKKVIPKLESDHEFLKLIPSTPVKVEFLNEVYSKIYSHLEKIK